MKRARRTALRKATGAFLIVHSHEMRVLEERPAWFARLWLALVSVTDFRTGFGGATYARLVEMCRPVQPRTGRRAFVPSVDAVRRAVLDFERASILARDRRHSVAAAFLFFRVAPRYVEVRAPSEFAGGIRRGAEPKFTIEDKGLAELTERMRRGNLQGSSTVVSFMDAQARANAGDTSTQRAMRARLKPRDPKK